MPMVRQGPMTDPTELSPDICRGVSETRDRKRETNIKNDILEDTEISAATEPFSGDRICVSM